MHRIRLLAALLLLAACGVGTDNSDGSAPLVGIDTPANNAVVGGQVPIQITALDDYGVDRVVVLVDNVQLAELFTPPFSTIWNTVTLQNNSQHVILARAYDVAGNMGSRQINVTVQNGPQ